MKKLAIILSFLVIPTLSFAANLLDIKAGEYNLTDGDEELCEEGHVALVNGDLKIGTRLILLQISKATYSYENDDKSCRNSVANIPQKNGLRQDIEQKCKDGTSKRSIFVSYLPPKLSYTISASDMKNKKINCSLEMAK